MSSSMFILSSESECEPALGIWGCGGWLPPEARPPEGREALDWLMLAKLSGWSASVKHRLFENFDAELDAESRWLVVACDPDSLSESEVAEIAACLAEKSLLVIARAGKANGAFAKFAGAARMPEPQVTGGKLQWTGNGVERVWQCRGILETNRLQTLSEETLVWATLDDAPLIMARRVGRGAVATLGFHPSAARDAEGSMTALLKHLLIWGACAPVAWIDLSNCLVLRMDDPGGAQNVHYRDWYYPKLDEAAWSAISADLEKRKARLSVCYIGGWLDDGDASRGELKIKGSIVENRAPGRAYPSPLVNYRDDEGHSPGTAHDYEAEFRGIQTLRAAGCGEVELHGWTHIHPNGAEWANAPDRYTEISWYRELGRKGEPVISANFAEKHPLQLGVEALGNYFGVRPTTLICPGDDWTEAVIERAIELGFFFVNDYHLAIRDNNRFCWTSHVCAPYLNEPDAAWFDAGLPVVGYFHDREVALEGVEWMTRWLDAWQEAGARRLLDFRELAATVGRSLRLSQLVNNEKNDFLLTVETDEHAPPMVRPLEIFLRVPGGQMPERVLVQHKKLKIHLDIQRSDDEFGSMMLPCKMEEAGANI